MDKVSKLGTIMGIWAHPDDDTFSMGGVYALASRNNQTTICITATRGELGIQDESRWPTSELAYIRTKEMEESLNILGVDYHHWLDYKDGECNDVDLIDASKTLATLIDKYQPDSIFTFGPDGITGHEDHKAMSRWTDKALEMSNSKATIYHVAMTNEAYEGLKAADNEFNMFFNTDNPCRCYDSECSLLVELPKEILNIKIKALEAMPSQTDRLFMKYRDDIKRWHKVERFVIKN